MWRASVLERPSPLKALCISTFSIMVSLLDMLALLEILCSSANGFWDFINFNERSLNFFV